MAHVRDVHAAQHLISLELQRLLQHVLHDVAAQVADVGVVVNRWAAGVHAHLARLMGDKGVPGSGQAVVQLHKKNILLCVLGPGLQADGRLLGSVLPAQAVFRAEILAGFAGQAVPQAQQAEEDEQ